jgi:hypothetical protein
LVSREYERHGEEGEVPLAKELLHSAHVPSERVLSSQLEGAGKLIHTLVFVQVL